VNSSDHGPIPSGEWVAIAILGKTRGKRGEILAIPLAGRPERFEDLQRVWLAGDSPLAEEGSRYEIESVWLHDGRPVLKFRGIDTISEAEALVGAEVRLPAAERMPLEEGEFYQADLIGCEVVEQPSGELLGEVTGWQEAGGPNLLQVRMRAGGELLIPFARAICVEIDVAARRIMVDLPAGLKELNRE
jgi:16S rRNA processing protein RimM